VFEKKKGFMKNTKKNFSDLPSGDIFESKKIYVKIYNQKNKNQIIKKIGLFKNAKSFFVNT